MVHVCLLFLNIYCYTLLDAKPTCSVFYDVSHLVYGMHFINNERVEGNRLTILYFICFKWKVMHLHYEFKE